MIPRNQMPPTRRSDLVPRFFNEVASHNQAIKMQPRPFTVPTDKISNLPPPKSLVRRILADTFFDLISLAADHLPPREIAPAKRDRFAKPCDHF